MLARGSAAMRPFLLFLVLVLLGGAVAIWFGLQDDPPVPTGIAPPADGDRGDRPGAPATGSGDAAGRRAPQSGDAVATTPTELRQPVDLAATPTAHLRIVAAPGARPFAGAAVYRYHREGSEAAIAYSDADGLVALPLQQPEQLVIAAPGYLLRLSPTQLGSTAAEPQVVHLVADEFSRRITVSFTQPDGTRPDEVLVRLLPAPPAARELAPPPGLGDASPAVQRAWAEHTQIASLQAVPEVPVQLGPFGTDAVLRLGAQDTVAFAQDGAFVVEAATRDGTVARTTIEVGARAPRRVEIRLQRGAAIEGVVRNVDGAPLGDARVALAAGDPLGLVATTDADGRFRLAPLADGVHALDVRHRDTEPATTPPIEAGRRDVEVALTPLPPGTLRGRVRARPGLQPIEGAAVSILDRLGRPVTAQTDAGGWFALRTSGTDAVRLNVAARGFLPFAELVDPAAGAVDCDLLPASPEARLAAGLTGVLTGVVVDAEGRPASARTVRWQPDRAASAAFAPDRRVLAGGSLALPQFAPTGEDGAFRLETEHLGEGMLGVAAGGGLEGAVRVEAVPGKVVDNLRLHLRR